MKRLDTSPISASTGFPVKAGTLEFLQDAYKEGLAGIVSNLIDDPQANTIYILSGCVDSNSSTTVFDISAGVLYLDGEIFLCDGASFTLTGLQKAYARIETTQFVTNADPVEFTDGVNRNVHNIRKIVIEGTTTNSGLPEFEDFVYVSVGKFFLGETKNIVMSSVDYAAKFVQSGPTEGLGLKEFRGWAVMNGNNGTENDDGYVEMGFGTNTTPLQGTKGSATKTLTIANLPDNGVPVTDGFTIGVQGGTTFNFGLGTQGSATPFSIVQPSKVRLRIQKI